MTTRSARAQWEQGLRCTVTSGRFQIVVDEPESAGGTDQGPQPTDLLLASFASCLTVALAYSANKRGQTLPGLAVTATGTYDGPSFAAVTLTVTADVDLEQLRRLVTTAERVCYVTNTVRRSPTITVQVPG